MKAKTQAQSDFYKMVKSGHIGTPKQKFNPNRAFINEAMEDYFRRGGGITRIENIKEDDYTVVVRENPDIDDFLSAVGESSHVVPVVSMWGR